MKLLGCLRLLSTEGLAFGRTVQAAFDLGLNELKLMGLKQDEEVPVLLVRHGLDAASVYLIGAASATSSRNA